MKQERTLQKLDSLALSNVDSNKYSSIHIAAIKYHLATGGEFPLSPFQCVILERLRYTDEIIRQGMYRKQSREDVVNLIVSKFIVARSTAWRDIVNAEDVFSSSYPLNKMYEIGLRIDYTKEQIRLASAANDFKQVSNLEKVLQGYIDMYPETKPEVEKKNLVFQFQQNNFNLNGNAGIAEAEPMSLKEALQLAQSLTDDSE